MSRFSDNLNSELFVRTPPKTQLLFSEDKSHEDPINPTIVPPNDNQYFSIHHSIGNGGIEYSEISKNLQIVHSNHIFSRKKSTAVDGDQIIKLHFKLSGDSFLEFEDGQQHRLLGGKAAIVVQPENIHKNDIQLAGVEENSFTILCTPSMLIDELCIDPYKLPQPFNSFVAGTSQPMFFQELLLSNKMLECIRELSTPLYAADLRRIHLKTKVTELICIMLDELIQLENTSNQSSLKQRDIDAIYNAKQLCTDVVDDPLSIEELARIVGINRTKLAEGFKSLFKETISQYQHRQRMNLAHKLILDKQGSFDVVASSVGYSHQSTFSAAFKAYFGYTPSKAIQHYKPKQ